MYQISSPLSTATTFFHHPGLWKNSSSLAVFQTAAATEKREEVRTFGWASTVIDAANRRQGMAAPMSNLTTPESTTAPAFETITTTTTTIASIASATSTHESPTAQSNTPIFLGGQSQYQSHPNKVVKRPRPVKSCISCRGRKLKCDRRWPCLQCQKSGRACKYATEPDTGGSEGSDLEGSPRPSKRARHRQEPSNDDTPRQSHTSAPFQGQLLNGAPAFETFGARLERLEKLVMDSASGSSSKAIAGEAQYVRDYRSTVRDLTIKDNLRTRFVGQNQTRVLLNLFEEARHFAFNRFHGDDFRDTSIRLTQISNILQDSHRTSMAPIPVFIDSMLPVHKRMADILPKKASCDKLLEAYFATSEGLYRVVHIPNFRAEYEGFWRQGTASDAFLPRLLCMLSIGSRFETSSRGYSRDRSDGVHVPTACALVRAWLDNLRGKQLVDFHTLQCEVLLLHTRRMTMTKSQESWSQLGFIVRMAMTMGLHRDPSEFAQVKPYYGELRRRLWYTIMDMDLHVALACNLPCAIREGEYTCKPPSNIDDSDLYPEMIELPPSRPVDYYTNSQLQAYAARTLPHRIRVSSIISRLDNIRDFDEVLECGGHLEGLLEDINSLFPRSHSLDAGSKFKEWRGRALLDMHVRRPLLMLYRPFALSTAECPPQITRSYLRSSMTMLTYLDELDHRMPGFSDVSHMYHVVLKHDIMQAAFSVCYFIRQATTATATAAATAAAAVVESPVTLASSLPSSLLSSSSSTAPPPSAYPYRAHLPPQPAAVAAASLQSTSAATATGPKLETSQLSFIDALDNKTVWSTSGMVRAVQQTLAGTTALVNDSTSMLKDSVVLSIVLNTVLGGPTEEKLQRVRSGLEDIIATGAVTLNISPRMLGSLGVSSSPVQKASITNAEPYLKPSARPMSPTAFFDESTFWDLDPWDPSTRPVGNE